MDEAPDLRFIDVVHHLPLGLRVIKKKKVPAPTAPYFIIS
jgi:hypothetical protein